MIKCSYNKWITFIIVALFVGTGVFPCISGYSRNNLPNSDKAISANLDEQIDQIGPTKDQTDLNAIDAKIPFGKFTAEDTVILAQSFKPSLPVLTKIELLLSKKTSTFGVTVEIKDSLGASSPLTSINLGNSGINNKDWTTFDFEDISVTP